MSHTLPYGLGCPVRIKDQCFGYSSGTSLKAQPEGFIHFTIFEFCNVIVECCVLYTNKDRDWLVQTSL